MNIFELFDREPAGYHTQKDDHSVYSKKDSNSRSSRLTIAHLHQLRISHDAKKLEHEKKLQAVSAQYKPPVEAGPAGGL
jgi:hypothetical protein